jgi:hypothetical protein
MAAPSYTQPIKTSAQGENNVITDILRPTNPDPLDPIDNAAFTPDSDIAALRVPRDSGNTDKDD